MKKLRVNVAVAANGMNKLETAYSLHLEARRRGGEIQLWQFEPFKFRLPGQKSFYTPDFLLVMADGTIQIHETKGHWHSRDRVRTKAAAGLYRYFRFVGVQRRRQRDPWEFEEIKPGTAIS